MAGMGPFAGLVLGGGGVLGGAWMTAALAGLHEAGGPDARASGCFIGTSAGSVVGAGLASGVAPHDRLERLAREPARARTPPAAAPPAGPPGPPLPRPPGPPAAAAPAGPALPPGPHGHAAAGG